MVLEDGVLEPRLPLPDHRQPLLGVLQAGLGLAEVLHLLAHRRRVVGPLLELLAEDLGLGHRDLLAAALDLVVPVGRPVLLEPEHRAADLASTAPSAASVSSPYSARRRPERLQRLDRMDRGLRAHRRRPRIIDRHASRSDPAPNMNAWRSPTRRPWK